MIPKTWIKSLKLHADKSLALKPEGHQHFKLRQGSLRGELTILSNSVAVLNV